MSAALPNGSSAQTNVASPGVLYVASTNPSALTGEWFGSAEDSPEHSDPRFDDRSWAGIAVPGQWNVLGIDAEVVWYRRHFQVRESLRDQEMAIAVPVIADAHELYLNGVLVGSRGHIARDGTLERKSNQPGVYRIPPGLIRHGVAADNVIAIRVADDVGWGGIVRSEFFIGGEPEVRRDFERQLMRRAGLTLAFLFTALLYFVFYFGSRQPSYLYYALYSAAGGIAVSAMGSMGYWFFDSFWFNHLLQHGAYHLIPFAFIGFLTAFFTLQPRVAPWVTGVTIPLLVVFALGFFNLWFLKLYAFYTMPLVLAMIILTTVYGAYVIVSSAVVTERGSQILLVGLVVLAAAVTNDVLNYFQIIDTVRIVPEGLLLFTGSLGFAVAYRFAEVYRQTDQLKEIFSQFVPHEFIDQLPVENVFDLRLGSQIQAHGTVLFCDIRSFTRMSENLTPSQVFDFINAYLAAVVPIIRAHGGVVDKFIGDGIMALFPAGTESDAIRCSIDLHGAMRDFKGPVDSTPIRIGVGLHTGDLMLGIIGAEHRLESTVISNTVNLASHLEALTKEHGSPIIISEPMRAHVPAEFAFLCRPLGTTNAKGQEGEVEIHGIGLPWLP